MKSRLLIAGLLIGLILSTTTAFAAETTNNRPYIGVAGILSFFHDSDVEVTGLGSTSASYETGYGFAASVGYKINPMRFEFEFGYRRADIDDIGGFSVGDPRVTVMSFMINGLYDINTNSPFTPYIGLGLGLLNGELKVEGSKEDSNEFGYQLIAGFAYNFNKTVALDFSYRFQHAPGDFSKDDVSIEYKSSNVMLGLRFTF